MLVICGLLTVLEPKPPYFAVKQWSYYIQPDREFQRKRVRKSQGTRSAICEKH